MLDTWCRTTYRQSKIRSDSLSRAAAVAAPLAVMSVRPFEKDQVALSQDHRWESPSGATIYLCRGRWNSEDVSQTTHNAVTKDSPRSRCRMSSRTCIGWYPTLKKYVIGTKQKHNKEHGQQKLWSMCGSTMKRICQRGSGCWTVSEQNSRRSLTQRIQADHSRRESWKSNSSQEPRASGKPGMHCFHQGATNREISSKVSMFKCADPSKLGRSLLDGNKDHLLSQARSELMRQEHQIGFLNSCIYELQLQAYAQGLELQDAHHGYVESRREQARLQEELSMKEKLLRHTQTRNIHESGEMKRAQELRVDEFLVQK